MKVSELRARLAAVELGEFVSTRATLVELEEELRAADELHRLDSLDECSPTEKAERQRLRALIAGAESRRLKRMRDDPALRDLDDNLARLTLEECDAMLTVYGSSPSDNVGILDALKL